MFRNVENEREAPLFEVIRNADINVKEDELTSKGKNNVYFITFSAYYIVAYNYVLSFQKVLTVTPWQKTKMILS